jgi:hypothetical protein
VDGGEALGARSAAYAPTAPPATAAPMAAHNHSRSWLALSTAGSGDAGDDAGAALTIGVAGAETSGGGNAGVTGGETAGASA